jgi:hypothetical protein
MDVDLVLGVFGAVCTGWARSFGTITSVLLILKIVTIYNFIYRTFINNSAWCGKARSTHQDIDQRHIPGSSTLDVFFFPCLVQTTHLL